MNHKPHSLLSRATTQEPRPPNLSHRHFKVRQAAVGVLLAHIRSIPTQRPLPTPFARGADSQFSVAQFCAREKIRGLINGVSAI